MPTYAYTCGDCGSTFEMQLSVEDRDDPTHGLCSLCDAANITRAIGCAGFNLKGPGWAKDGYSTHYGDAIKAQGKKNGEQLD